MGNHPGKSTHLMALTALANEVQIDRKEVLELHKEFRRLAKKEGNDCTISKCQLKEALALVGVIESDAKLLERLFDLIDTSQDGQINFREYICGIVPLINGSLTDKLSFSFEIYDMDKTGQLKPEEMIFILNAMNDSVEYFGEDKKISKQDVEVLVKEIFQESDQSHTGTLSFDEYADAVTKHPGISPYFS